MTERPILLERLKDLRDLSKTKKYRLAKPEQEEVLSVLSELCTMDEEGYRVTVETLTDFPSDLGSVLLAQNWASLMEAKAPVPRDLRNVKFNTHSGKSLRVALARRLIETFPEDAFDLLVDVFRQMKPAKNPMPASKDLGLVRFTLIEPAGKSLSRLPLEEAGSGELALFITCILAATFVCKNSQKPLATKTQLAVIDCVKGHLKQGQLPSNIQVEIAHAVKAWEKDPSVSEQELNVLQTALREVLTPAGHNKTPESPLEALQSTASTGPPVVTAQAHSSTPSHQYNALYEIERVGKYVRQLQSQLEQTQHRLQMTERDWQQTRNELGVVRQEKEEALRQASVEHSLVTRLSEEKSLLQKEIDALQTQIVKLTQELDAAHNHYKEAVASHGEQLDTLSERIAREGEHRIDAFRNKLGAMLQIYADGLKDATEMEMTSELGAALRNQMGQLLRLLKMEGVRINGGQ